MRQPKQLFEDRQGCDPVSYTHLRSGGEAAGEARKAVEARTGVPVITSQKAVDFTQLIENIGEAAALPLTGDEPEKDK